MIRMKPQDFNEEARRALVEIIIDRGIDEVMDIIDYVLRNDENFEEEYDDAGFNIHDYFVACCEDIAFGHLGFERVRG